MIQILHLPRDKEYKQHNSHSLGVFKVMLRIYIINSKKRQLGVAGWDF